MDVGNNVVSARDVLLDVGNNVVSARNVLLDVGYNVASVGNRHVRIDCKFGLEADGQPVTGVERR